MPVPSLITDLSQTAASNYPQGTDSPSTLDDVQRAHGSFIAKLRDGQGHTNPITLASAATADIGGQTAFFVEISGTTTITSFGTNYNGPRFLRFTGAVTITYNATSLILPGAASITTAAGDTCIAVPNQALNGWTVVSYTKAASTPATNAEVTAAIAANPGVPAGTVISVAMNSAPSGYLKCNGAAVSRTTYATLFSAIGTTYGVGDGSTTFNVPELRGEFVRGWDDARGIDSGRAIGTTQQDAFQGHYHSMNAINGTNTGATGTTSSAQATSVTSTGAPITDGTNGTPRTAAETRPRNVSLLYCIKT
jgi:microcystin-dependent protein